MATISVDDNENLEKAIKRFKRMVEKEGIIREYKKREYYEKPSTILNRKNKALQRKLLKKNHGMFYINQAVDTYNRISLESKLALGAHNIDQAKGNITLRFTDGSERFVPIGQSEPIPVAAHEYSYCDDAHEVLCRLEIRQVEKTKVDEKAQNIFYIVQGNDATPDELLQETAQRIIDLTTRYCGGQGKIIVPSVI
jgi:ribosomal protein S21